MSTPDHEQDKPLVKDRDRAAKVRSEHYKPEPESEQQTIDKLRAGLGGMVRTLARVVEVRDPFKVDHHRIVANLARAVAGEMQLSREQIEGVRLAASIHDLGKVYVPPEILTKPTRITDAEYALIKTHPGIAYNILSDAQVPFEVAAIVLQHHERINGSGYPYGLKGDAIRIEARILAVTDVIEAMLSPRPYRPALSMAQATHEVFQKSGELFDRQVAEACLDLFSTRQLDDFR
jgi:HD-GYP domain-containing protein (c-di-GMP phosphodiesterase class II)